MTGHDKSEHWIARGISAGTHHLPAALMVAALVYIGHHHLHLLKAIDGYAFLGIGNRTAFSQYTGSHPTVAVVLIDQKSNEDYYRERSPLDRCQLKQDLEAIYNLSKPPKLLVVDLDLSPVLPLNDSVNEKTKECDEQLKTLLMQDRTKITETVKNITHTVLITPFEMLDYEAQKKNEDWKESLKPFVSFADDPTINVSFGLVNDLDCNHKSLAAVAFKVYSNSLVGLEKCPEKESEESKRHVPPLIISPAQYLSGLQAVSLCQLPSRLGDNQCKGFTLYNARYYYPVVFVGSSFGDSDTFLTPLGIMYGVEVHAAAFMSLVEPTDEISWFAFILDVALGLLMGGLIDLSWRYYFSFRFSSSAVKRQWAPWLILLLAIGFTIVVVVLTIGSYGLLRHCSIWLSPIPIALGMLIESFFNGAISTAVKEGYEQRQAMIRRLQASGPDSFASKLALEAEQRPHYAHTLQERAKRFVYLDCLRLWRAEKHCASTLLFMRRLTFLLVLLLAFFWDEIVPPVMDFFFH
ncbi:CHASE2 domain-containing protein [Pseudomonas sp. C2B4]|uniref:CHASE2 domain-containing protein n=1 Tax=Pseudomonas sp. C2B4 TaxID=2735270 RepID=UPI001586A1F4|nr:CHASE2 domain-containing protein [Pseudomonas sp. C2B4]NUU39290.1 CHASE2 domain-containing protein [Pseudomonas sp. C2B4]